MSTSPETSRSSPPTDRSATTGANASPPPKAVLPPVRTGAPPRPHGNGASLVSRPDTTSPQQPRKSLFRK
ncbi:hypothetical protein [Komagataeibacter sp. FNDCR2]|uniref:hypothetical protein n=1 Tax=Komagataeibacter sp. FNDCR2 TaxID=2878682 RepID=UPI001E3BAFB3|nr:hypothetical protein [Komagataeibacter sp. FNDCR2]MCE2575157.1 hypothetical protein [Komagataeibacter sp. FNDCR2]